MARIQTLITAYGHKINKMNDNKKYDDDFKEGDIICPHCGFDKVGYEFSPDMIETQGVDETTCPECEKEIKFELTYKFKVLDND